MNNQKKENKELDDSWDNTENNQPFLQNMNNPSYLNGIQPRYTQVWNCDIIVFNNNGRCNKVICTYKFYQGELMWKVQSGYLALLWFMLLVFNQADGQWFMPHIIVHQSREYSK